MGKHTEISSKQYKDGETHRTAGSRWGVRLPAQSPPRLVLASLWQRRTVADLELATSTHRAALLRPAALFTHGAGHARCLYLICGATS